MPTPIQTLRLLNRSSVRSCSHPWRMVLIWESRWTVVDVPGSVTPGFLGSLPNYTRPRKSWCTRRDAPALARKAGHHRRDQPFRRKRLRHCAPGRRTERAARRTPRGPSGSAASSRSSSRASSGDASPSRTACINCVSSEGFMSIRPRSFSRSRRRLPRLEQAGFHGLLVQFQDLADLLVAALGKVAQRQYRPVVRRHAHQRALDPPRHLRVAGLAFRIGALGSREVDLVVELLRRVRCGAAG